MDLSFYQNKILQISQRITVLKKAHRHFGFLRLFVFTSALILFYFLFPVHNILALILLVIFIISFFYLIRKQNRLSKNIKELQKMHLIYENEITVIETGVNLFGTGEEFVDVNHPYTGDLDIFGRNSMFNLINRSTTNEGKNKLAKFLSEPSPIWELKKRQEAILELSKREDFKENMLVESIHLKKKKIDQRIIASWFEGFKFGFLNLAPFQIAFHLISLLMLLLIPISFIYDYVYLILFFVILISIIFNFYYFGKVNIIHEKISKQSDLFANYSRLVSIISKSSFESTKLTSLKNELKKPNQIISELRVISRLIEQLDYRLNAYVAFFLNTILFWDIRKSIQIERWLKKNHSNIDTWLNPIGEIDALLSMSIFLFNHPDYSFPDFKEQEEVYINTIKIGHPLIPAENRICNDYKIKGKGHFDLITGSNMAGKTTFLRTIGINSVLALSGNVVCAENLVLSNFRIMTYMRITDSLEYNLSTFHAEIQRIRHILDFAKQKEACLLLLDELLRGTNSKDRASGTKALITHLINENTTGLVSTHDLSLTSMEQENPEKIRNFHFDIVNKDDDLDFDYKLKKGVSQTTNAGMLLRKIGLVVE